MHETRQNEWAADYKDIQVLLTATPVPIVVNSTHIVEPKKLEDMKTAELVQLWYTYWKNTQRTFCTERNIDDSNFSKWKRGLKLSKKIDNM